ncbi:MAG: ABC transporter substrate-binding protein [Anaerolineae bacterium]
MNRLTLVLLALMTFISVYQPVLAQPEALASNPQECVTDYDPDVDYFPDKATVTSADNFTVEYFNNYKIVTVSDAFDNAVPFTYVLVQCGTPAPPADDFPPNTLFTEVPSADLIALSTTLLPHIVDLELLDQLIGLDSFDYVSAPAVRERIDEGELIAVGSGTSINVEVALDSETDLVLTNAFNPDTDAYPLLIESGIFTAISADWRESEPLGRAEWIKHTALFYNAEARANTVYDNIVNAYEEARDLALSVPEEDRPVVLWNSYSGFSEAWVISGSESYAGRLIEDAGGIIALGEEAPEDSAFLSFEAVFDGAFDADVWVTNLFMVETVSDLLAMDARYADFLAVETGNVWNNNLDVNENGGVNYFELGVTNPHLILQDLVAIFHPELLPDHAFNFFQPLTDER